MSTSYFAHAAYGVLLTEAEDKRLWALCLKRLEEEKDEYPDAIRDVLAQIVENNPTLVEKLRKKYEAPPNAVLIYTGDEDSRPGLCATESEQFILGFGVLSFPFRVNGGAKFMEKAQWYSWVEAG